jgi:hypothetical protein
MNDKAMCFILLSVYKSLWKVESNQSLWMNKHWWFLCVAFVGDPYQMAYISMLHLAFNSRSGIHIPCAHYKYHDKEWSALKKASIWNSTWICGYAPLSPVGKAIREWGKHGPLDIPEGGSRLICTKITLDFNGHYWTVISCKHYKCKSKLLKLTNLHANLVLVLRRSNNPLAIGYTRWESYFQIREMVYYL